ncbi:DUF1223 domain-containing protein [Erythrobacter sp. WG]|uniref:DUF1223 domain-containing protein n=1 Tax=Erythrobacter sp. WG TaxID=2985510 RepID=UPI0022719FB9|nr:DUF1223 domain-containing protein [Erythrobacter sp. WG]MCX9148318.1 DUF1223 domain-containing protein [Erythrobacter sp. WG]
MTRTRTFIVLIGGLAALAGGAFALPHTASPAPQKPLIAASAAPVLLELFTSQGCSSCPPADALAETLAGEPGLVVITRPVTYWDRLGWKDTLGRESNTVLQQNYARRGLGGTNGVYTPQLVVDGRIGVVGSRGDDIADAVRRAGGDRGASIAVAKNGAGGYAIDLSGKPAGAAELVLIAVKRHIEVAIGSGENGGRKVGYANVLRAETRLADWTGGPAKVAIGPERLAVAGADRYALVLRAPGGGTVLAARWLS